jgi:glycosyltransferase involved in cell wall biosynthesis
MHRLLIVNKKQFGYHTDTYQYCKHLKDDFNITYIGLDNGKAKIDEKNINVIYTESSSNVFFRYLLLLMHVGSYIKKNKFDIIFFKYFPGISVFKLFKNKNTQYVFDVRTGYVHPKMYKRKIMDSILKLESFFFENISIISDSLAQKLGLKGREPFILPLGSEVIYEGDRDFNEFNLIYVGTLDQRRIDQTIVGFSDFLKQYKDVRVTYHIVGSSNFGNEEKLMTLINNLGLNNYIQLHGYVPHNKLYSLFKKCNIGVSFIPITDYYNCQPPTKTFEYLLSGMPVIATETIENAKVMDDSNGVLITDSAKGFKQGVEEIHWKLHEYDDSLIRKSVKEYQWKNIIQKELDGYLKTLIENK